MEFHGHEYLRQDTICAPFTPPGRGAMSAIRLSGPDSFNIAEKIIGKAVLDERKLHVAYFIDAGELIDRPLVAKFPSPNSFTGEDVVEFHVHGSPYVVQRVMRVLVDGGAREALPGEFSFRAYLNGRMDLTQAEGLAELIDSRTREQHRAAINHLAGGLRERIVDLRERLLRLLAAIEVTFDHPGEIVEAESVTPIPEIEAFITELRALADTYERGRLVREGFRLGIFGRPNVGKSSLLNRLVGRRRAIVDDAPGTTRDVIEAPVEIGGIEMKVVDTAGLRKGAQGVEAMGQELAREEILGSDIRLIMLDGSEPLTDDDMEMFGMPSNENALVLINKIDLPAAIDTSSLKSLARDIPIVRISCKTGECIDELITAICEMLPGGEGTSADIVITSSRHHSALKGAMERLESTLDILKTGLPEDVAALEIRAAVEKLQGITGGDFSEDLYTAIFAEFCIGK